MLNIHVYSLLYVLSFHFLFREYLCVKEKRIIHNWFTNHVGSLQMYILQVVKMKNFLLLHNLRIIFLFNFPIITIISFIIKRFSSDSSIDKTYPWINKKIIIIKTENFKILKTFRFCFMFPKKNLWFIQRIIIIIIIIKRQKNRRWKKIK